jgi:hypothetical protein
MLRKEILEQLGHRLAEAAVWRERLVGLGVRFAWSDGCFSKRRVTASAHRTTDSARSPCCTQFVGWRK